MPEWSIIIHGGAKDIKPDEESSHRSEALRAVQAGASVLREKGTALEAVESAIKAMEEGGIFNAGQGSVKGADGKTRMDASIMDGKTLKIGAVAGLKNIKNPVSVARALMDEKPILIAGEYANDFAAQKGFSEQGMSGSNDATPCDTVGCVARDHAGNIAVGLSTGGLSGTMPGRIGDVPLPGCGFYADNERAGLCFSGDGESIARLMLAADIFYNLEDGPAQGVIEKSLAKLERVGGEAGCILIDAEGKISWSHTSSHFSVACQTSDEETPSVYLRKEEK